MIGTKMTPLLIVPLSLFLIFTTLISFAQQRGNDSAYLLEIDERVTSPGTPITVHIRAGDLRTASIRSVRWFVDGQEQKEEEDSLSLQEVVGNSAKNVTAQIIYFTQSGNRRYMSASTQITPVTFDLLWEGESVTTPLYRGYPLAGPQVPIRVYAEIQYVDSTGVSYTEDDFSFVWEVETKFHETKGPGASSIVHEEGGTLINNRVFVLARATLINNTSVRYEKAINIPITDPRLLVYSYTPVRGLITEYVIPQDIAVVDPKQPITAALYPFYFSARDFSNNITMNYHWFVNNAAKPSKRGRKVDISLRGEDASIPIRVFARNEEKTLQTAKNTLEFHL